MDTDTSPPAGGTPSRAAAWELVCEWTTGDSLRRHMLAVEAAMRWYAAPLGGDVELWGLAGLLHDLDYERHPDLTTGHPRVAMALLSELGYPPELIRAIGSHADYLEISRDSDMEKALYAVDELSGFVLAVAYVRPEGLTGMTAKSVRKKMKQASFAAAVSRDDLVAGAQALGIEFDQHVANVIAALDGVSDSVMPAA